MIYPLQKELLMSESCKWLHEQAEILPMVLLPFQLTDLPDNGINIFYEERDLET